MFFNALLNTYGGRGGAEAFEEAVVMQNRHYVASVKRQMQEEERQAEVEAQDFRQKAQSIIQQQRKRLDELQRDVNGACIRSTVNADMVRVLSEKLAALTGNEPSTVMHEVNKQRSLEYVKSLREDCELGYITEAGLNHLMTEGAPEWFITPER